MPYHIDAAGPGKFEVIEDSSGKVVGTHPTRKQALGQLKALYANVPEARKEASEMETTDKALFNAQDMRIKGASSDPGDYLIAEDREHPTTWHLQVRTNGKPDHGLMGGAWAALHEGYRGNKYEGPDKGAAIEKLKKLYHAEEMTYPGESDSASKEAQPSWLDRVIATIKGDTPGHEFHGNQYSSGGGGGSGGSNEGESSGNESSGSINNSPEHLKSVVASYDKDISDVKKQLSKTSRTQFPGKYKKLSDRLDGLESSKRMYQRRLEETHKEGRRNSSPDGDRLQQIHDLAVLNGASCPMVMKEASGKLRWVLLSSNAFQDSDKEIISQKALETDVARTDKTTAPYGPLRWWHMGAPDPIALNAGSGADIGDCDYRAMSGRVLIESGTFRNEQIGAAVKERADSLAGSIGFFHPKDQPDHEGVYQTIVQFERSLLPRGKASNTLTALTVKGDQDMATSKEKSDALAALLGDPKLAEAVIKQAEATEKAADDRGLKYKEQEAETKEPTGNVTAVPATGANGINPIGLEKDGKQKKGAEGSPEEEASESPAEAAAEPDYEAMFGKMRPHIEKMIKEYMSSSAKEAAEKGAGLKAQLDQLLADVKELKGDVPRGLQGFRASLSEATILSGINTKAAPTADPLDDVISQLMGVKKS